MKKVCLIRQPAGIGDIMFCQKIASAYQAKGYEILWPIDEVYIDVVKNYLGNFNYVSEEENFVHKDWYMDLTIREIMEDDICIFIPLDQHNLRDSVLYSKYKLVGLDYKDWKDYLHIKRNYKKEEELFYMLGLKEGLSYIFVNRWYASPPFSKEVKNFMHEWRVEMHTYEGYSIFDWIKVFENAKKIYTTDCGLTLIIERIKPKIPQEYTIMLRQPDPSRISGMYELDWKYIKSEI